MSYIAVLDFENLDNGIFLHAFAQALARHQRPGIIIHGDSEYTNRIMQTGVMRDDASRRAIKDLNLRLTALLADAGVPAVAMHGFHKDAIQVDDAYREESDEYVQSGGHEELIGNIAVRRDQLVHPPGTVLLLSALAGVGASNRERGDGPGARGASERSPKSSGRQTRQLPLPVLAHVLMRELHIDQLILFSHAKQADFIKLELPESMSKMADRDLLEEHVSSDFLDSVIAFHLATPDRFGREELLPELPLVR